MPIQEGNIRLLAAQVMDDVNEGGGQATGTPIADGASNAIFPDISELDRAIGRVNLRKTFVHVDTASQDGYYGAHVIVATPPSDAHVSCTLFSTRDGFDRRSDAQNRLEAYVLSGPLSRMVLYGTQFIGQRVIRTYQRDDEALPEVGQVFVLSAESAVGVVSAQQYFRVTEVTHEVRTFTDGQGDFRRRVVTLRTSDALRQTFVGKEPVRTSAVDYANAQVRETQVADATQYFATTTLTEPVTTGALAVKAASIYTQLVPSSNVETPVSLGQIAAALGLQPTAAGNISETLAVAGSVGVPLTARLRRGVAPGTFNFASGMVVDNGAGQLTGAWVNSAQPSSIDYATGVFAFVPTGGFGGSWPASYTPAVEIAQAAHTVQMPVTLATRGSVYVATVSPAPLPGSLVVDFLAMGKWYRLRDNRAGALSGADPSVGSGSVDYATGAVVVTLGALPDVGSATLFAWGSPAHYAIAAGATADATSTVEIRATLSHTPVIAGSVTATWLQAGASKTATTDVAGVFSGHGATGRVNHTTGEVVLQLTSTPDAGANVVMASEYLEPALPGAPTAVNKIINGHVGNVVTLGEVIAPGGLTVGIEVSGIGAAGRVTFMDDGAGNLSVKGGQKFDALAQGAPQAVVSADTIVGIVNYAAGTITLTGNVPYTLPEWQMTFAPGSGGGEGSAYTPGTVSYAWHDRFYSAALNLDAPITVSIKTTAAGTPTPVSDTVLAADLRLRIDVTATKGHALVPHSLLLRVAGKQYFDRNGVLYTDHDAATGSALAAGTIDYATGAVELASWSDGALAIAVLSCLTQYGHFTAIGATFRTAGAPLRPASLYVQVTTAAGENITATADQNGVITGAKMHGHVDSTTGVVALSFGQRVTAAGHEAEPWYDAANVGVDGKIWQPLAVLTGTLRYNAVVVASMPLDAGIIGIDPVRLPSDGRVPFLRTGNIAVIHHAATLGPVTVSNGQTLNAGRTRLARVKVIGNNGATITTGYSADLDAGTITFANVAGYSQPITVVHRVEDAALIADAQISGDLRFTRQLTHDYPAGSYVSSALIIGDMRARVPVLFDQQTFNNVWSDTLIGSAATATYNEVVAPIAVRNAGAITERWAIVFTAATSFNVIGEHVGQIANGTINSDCAPTNPATNTPYFTIPLGGWGLGWSVGNVLRFNTQGALFPVWIARTIQQGVATAQDDAFEILIRGDIDRP